MSVVRMLMMRMIATVMRESLRVSTIEGSVLLAVRGVGATDRCCSMLLDVDRANEAISSSTRSLIAACMIGDGFVV